MAYLWWRKSWYHDTFTHHGTDWISSRINDLSLKVIKSVIDGQFWVNFSWFKILVIKCMTNLIGEMILRFLRFNDINRYKLKSGIKWKQYLSFSDWLWMINIVMDKFRIFSRLFLFIKCEGGSILYQPLRNYLTFLVSWWVWRYLLRKQASWDSSLHSSGAARMLLFQHIKLYFSKGSQYNNHMVKLGKSSQFTPAPPTLP